MFIFNIHLEVEIKIFCERNVFGGPLVMDISYCQPAIGAMAGMAVELDKQAFGAFAGACDDVAQA